VLHAPARRRPRADPLGTWEIISTNWNATVKSTFFFGQEPFAVRCARAHGWSSCRHGAALGGSPMSRRLRRRQWDAAADGQYLQGVSD